VGKKSLKSPARGGRAAGVGVLFWRKEGWKTPSIIPLECPDKRKKKLSAF